VKKPVAFGFLDFSTLALRRHYCEEEVRLNRRLAPDVYLGVVPLNLNGDRLQVAGPGETVEWAVQMRRLPEAATLASRLLHGEDCRPLLVTLANRLAQFQAAAESKPNAGAAAVERTLQDLLRQSEPQLGSTVSQPVFERLRELIGAELVRCRPLIEARARLGLVRDLHGDLHLDHVYCFPDQPPPGDLVIVDCIEFNERLRLIDPVADMAFSCMDLLFHGRRDLAATFAAAYFQASGDHQGRDLLPLYTAYRALVRGSVEGLKLAEPEIAAADRAATLASSRAHWLVGLGVLEAPDRRPCVVLVGGLPGAGKSTLARGLAEQAGCTVVRSDVVRKELAHQSETLYSATTTERTYAECLRRAEALVFRGQRVVVDATFRLESQRRLFLDAARRWGVPGMLLVVQAEPALVRQRLATRRGDASDADWAVYLQLAGSWEETSLPNTCRLDGGQAEAEVIRQGLAALPLLWQP